MPTLNSIQRTIRRVRQIEEAATSLPHDLMELVIPEELVKSHDGEVFLKYDSGPGSNRILIFSTRRALDWLEMGDVLLSDGTFSVVPDLFSQLYTFHSYKDGQSIPCFFALTKNRTENTYNELLTFLKREKPAYFPRLFVSDYEQAIRNAITTGFPTTTIHGCFFHFSQAI